jgi:hypothetical protein
VGPGAVSKEAVNDSIVGFSPHSGGGPPPQSSIKPLGF